MATLLDYALCTVADVKELLGITSGDNSKNNLIIRKINQATRMIENYTNRRFKETTYTDELYDGTGTNQLVLKQAPISSVSLSVRDTTDNVSSFDTIDTEDYFLNETAGIITNIGSFYGGVERWRVTYTAGYATIPEDVAEACAILAAYLVENPTGSGTGVKRKNEGSRSIEYFEPTLSMSLVEQLGIDDMLESYVRYVV